MKRPITTHVAFSCLISIATLATADEVMQDPASVDALPVQTQLPDLLQFQDGRRVTSAEHWQARRDEIKSLLLHYQYGSLPPRPDRVVVADRKTQPYPGGLGTTEALTLRIESEQQPFPLDMRMLMFVPQQAKPHGPLPVIIREEGTLDGNDFVPTLLKDGYIYIEYARHDLDPDKKDVVGPAQRAYPDYDWATLAVWAWGGMRVVDYLETRPEADISRIAITGHSRGGKMALLAGALDERFALVAPVQSGAGGAGSYTMIGPGGESLAMNDKPHWYADRLRQFIGKAERLPFDQHFLKALVAPRALLCIESVDDDYANPVGTQLTTIAAQPAFDWYPPSPRIRNALIYRRGGHSFNTLDWQTLRGFTAWHFFGQKPRHASLLEARPYDLPQEWYPTGIEPLLRKGFHASLVSVPQVGDRGEFQFSAVGDEGNAAADDYFGRGRFGAVSYAFEMATRQVSNSQYADFLNAIENAPASFRLFDDDMSISFQQHNGRNVFRVDADVADLPVTHVTWFAAARYCNWLHNGKPRGPVGDDTTEAGAYRFAGPRQVSERATTARFALPGDDEWFKAAYYRVGRGYRLFEKTNQGELRVVDYSHDAISPYGITGMYDRLWEWNEDPVNGLFRSVRSGAWFVGNNKQAAGRLYATPDLQLPNVGFRVVRLRP